ncbi:hypothetical protein CASFOL_036593 [Castilleja foliolosa]|uniref:Uncharacterized protein n=1 Tax=Castilleja foliolosa TaxID=1961234 RepID=A0ABD3BS37_9LAMI
MMSSQRRKLNDNSTSRVSLPPQSKDMQASTSRKRGRPRKVTPEIDKQGINVAKTNTDMQASTSRGRGRPRICKKVQVEEEGGLGK